MSLQAKIRNQFPRDRAGWKRYIMDMGGMVVLVILMIAATYAWREGYEVGLQQCRIVFNNTQYDLINFTLTNATLP